MLDMITIIDYGAGNLASIRNMLRSLSVESEITSDPNRIEQATKLILPGVGAFDHGMENLHNRRLIDVLNRKVLTEKTPILGICLGVQLFTKRSEEGTASGLGWLDAETIRFDPSLLDTNDRVPHMGWRDVEISRSSKLTKDLPTDSRFYFVHSYHLRCNSPADILLSARYGYSFASGVERENIFGVQFHPEKSHRFGKKLLANYATLN